MRYFGGVTVGPGPDFASPTPRAELAGVGVAASVLVEVSEARAGVGVGVLMVTSSVSPFRGSGGARLLEPDANRPG